MLERFNRDYLPWIRKYGSEIGEKAMLGDKSAEAVVLRYQAFTGWLTDWALQALDEAMRDFEKRRLH